MAAVTLQKLRQVLKEAYQSGYAGCLDMADKYVDDAMTELTKPAEPLFSANDGWHTWTVYELRNTPMGTIMEHATRGKGWIEKKAGSIGITFNDGTHSTFSADSAPWNEPMRQLGKILPDKPISKKRSRH